MSVRGKFKVTAIEQMQSHRYNQVTKTAEPVVLTTIKMDPVSYNPDNPESENSKFWDASPTGEIRLGCINPEAAAQFELGAEYYVDFTKAE